jgi:Spy/CpxP family protein refolding chaperone
MSTLARLGLIAALIAVPAWAQETKSSGYSAEEAASFAEMHAIESEIGPEKRAFIEQQLELTAEQGAKFWPIYDAYQEALRGFNQRRLDNILKYARAYNAGAIDDATATAIAEEALDLEKDEAGQMEHTFRKLRKVVPAVKAVRYLQVENKLRAIVRFEQAVQVPLAD